MTQAAYACTLNQIAQTRIDAVITPHDHNLSILHFHHDVLVHLQHLSLTFRQEKLNSQWLPFIHHGKLRFLINVDPFLVITPNVQVGGECMLYTCYSNFKTQFPLPPSGVRTKVAQGNIITTFQDFVLFLYYNTKNKDFSLVFLHPQSLLFIGESTSFRLLDEKQSGKWEAKVVAIVHDRVTFNLEIHYTVMGESQSRILKIHQSVLQHMCTLNMQ